MRQLPYCSIFCGMTGREVTDMIYTRGLERRLLFNSDTLMNPSTRAVFENCRRFFSRRHGKYVGADLFDQESEIRADKQSRKAAIRSQSRGGPR